MKKAKAIAIIFVMALIIGTLAGCSNQTEAAASGNGSGKEGRFVVVEKDRDDDMEILVDKETGVMYLHDTFIQCGGLEVMVDTEGNPLVWEGELP